MPASRRKNKRGQRRKPPVSAVASAWPSTRAPPSAFVQTVASSESGEHASEVAGVRHAPTAGLSFRRNEETLVSARMPVAKPLTVASPPNLSSRHRSTSAAIVIAFVTSDCGERPACLEVLAACGTRWACWRRAGLEPGCGAVARTSGNERGRSRRYPQHGCDMIS